MAFVDVLSNPDSYNGLDNSRSFGSYEHCIQSPPSTLQDGLEVTEAGKAVKVQTDKPHLVSLGSGRLSTSVTLHPLQEGLTRIGTADAPVPQDIIIAGTGVEREHCYVDNNDGVVNLHPISTQISVDGIKVTSPTRLTQGCMICLGRSNYFRFNHPQEAQMMRNIFPNSRISVFPINFNQDMSSAKDIPRSAPSPNCNNMSTSYTSPTQAEQFRDEYESEDFVEKVSKFEFLAHSKQSSPAEQQWWFVKEGLRFPQHNTLPRSTGSSHVRTSTTGSFSPPCSSTPSNGSKQLSPLSFSSVGSPTSLPPLPPSKPLKITNSSNVVTKILNTSPRSYSSYTNSKLNFSPPPVPMKPGSAPPPKPQLSSAKLPTVIKLDPHISPKIFLPMSTSTNPTTSVKPRHLAERCSPAYHQQNGLGSHCSLEDLRHCERELHLKHQQVVKERLQEQELGKQEQQRLEEILNMCAEYERQVQLEKGSKQNDKPSKERRDCHDSSTSSGAGSSPLPSPNHIIHMNRIKTNGSLPRDKIPGYLSSPRESLSPVHPARSFKSTSSEDELEHIFDFSSLPCNYPSLTKGKDRMGSDSSGDPLGCYATYPQSPRTHIKTVVANKVNTISAADGAGGEIFENQLALTISDDQILSFEKNASSRSSSSKSAASLSPKKHLYADGRYLGGSDLHQQSVYPKMDIMSPSPPLLSPHSANHDDISSLGSRIDKMQDLYGEKGLDALKQTKNSLIQQNSDLRAKILELESQEEEALHEFEMEFALLDGEFHDKQSVLQQQQGEFKKLRQQERELAEASDKDRTQEQVNIMAARHRVEELERQLVNLEKEVETIKQQGKDPENVIERIQCHQEMLDTERKNFEDLEFHLLEHDAHREEEKEQILQKLNKMSESCLATEEAIADLVKQKNDLLGQVKKEISITEQERQMLLLQFKMEKQRLSAIEAKLSNGVVWRPRLKIKIGSPDGSPRSSDGELQNRALEEKLRQLGVIGRYSDPEDLISRVTASVSLLPKDGTASVRTAATLQEIERSRQKMLEVQGALVIEQERRRVEEIKRRVANEVCIQWQERKLRETSSLPSSESERSSASSSDMPAESVTSDEAFGKLTDSERNSSSVSTGKESDDQPDKVQQREQKLLQAAEDMRPLSGSSSQEDWMDVKLREKHRLQRPLTRYLPIRSENFNLKQHIESAGHQIDQCAQVQLNPISCRGYLHKMGSKFKTWNKRWFVFDRSKRTLVYYTDKHEHKPRGGVYFQAIEEVYVDHLHSVKSPNPKLTFCVKTLDRTYYLMAPNAEAMRIWVDVIFTGAEGYREFQLEI